MTFQCSEECCCRLFRSEAVLRGSKRDARVDSVKDQPLNDLESVAK